MDYLYIALIVLVLFGVWAVVEVALTMRSARKSIDKITTSASEVIEQAQPIVAKLDGVVDELEPAAKRLGPLMDEADEAARSVDTAFCALGFDAIGTTPTPDACPSLRTRRLAGSSRGTSPPACPRSAIHAQRAVRSSR